MLCRWVATSEDGEAVKFMDLPSCVLEDTRSLCVGLGLGSLWTYDTPARYGICSELFLAWLAEC